MTGQSVMRHFLLISDFSHGPQPPRALCRDFDSYFQDRKSYDFISFRLDLLTQAFCFFHIRLFITHQLRRTSMWCFLLIAHFLARGTSLRRILLGF